MTWLLPVLAVLLSACAATQPADGDSSPLQEQIRNGAVIVTGDRVRITTSDGAERVIDVSSVDGRSVQGVEEATGTDTPVISIAIDDIVRVEPVETEAAAFTPKPEEALFLAVFGILMVIANFITF
ncbi:MAG: hypothetical protein ABFS22_13785 [Pseudomonadota bacterium]